MNAFEVMTRLSRTLRRLVRALHVHRWKTTRYNGFYIDVEQVCRGCWSYRHHLFCDIDGDKTHWRPGKHPNRDNAYNPNTPDQARPKKVTT